MQHGELRGSRLNRAARRGLTSLLALAVLLPTGALVVASGSSAAVDTAGPATSSEASQPRARTRKLQFPHGRSAGVPRGWEPRRTVNGDLVVGRQGAVVEDVRVMGDLVVDASDVTLRRVEVLGGSINNWAGGTCHSGLRIIRSTVARDSGQTTSGDEPAITAGGYTARRVRIDGLPEGFRVGGKAECGPVKISHSWATVTSPDDCGDWHGDALQGYDGARLTVRNSRLDLVERDGCGGTAPFFYPDGQGNTSVDIDGLIVTGGGYAFRLGTPGVVRNLAIVKGTWYYGPIDVRCSALGAWDAYVARLDQQGQPVRLRGQRCNTEAGE